MARVNEIAFTEIKGTATIKATCRKESDDIRDDVGDLLDGNVEGIGKYPIGRKITLKAPAIEGYYFYGWKEKYDYQICCVNPEMDIQVTDDIDYVAIYEEMPTGIVDSNMTLIPEGAWGFGNKIVYTSDGGKLTVNFTVSENDTKYLSFESENGYATTELSLYVDGEFYGTYGKYEENGEKGIIPFSGGNHTVTWVVTNVDNVLYLRNISLIDEDALKDEKFSVTVENKSSNGSVQAIDSTGASTNPTQTGGVEYNYGEEVTLKAVLAEGEHFLGWIAPDGTFITDSEVKVTIKKDMVYKAYFTSDSNTAAYSNAVTADSKYSIQFKPSAWFASESYSDDITYIKTNSGSYLSNTPLSAVVTVPDGEENMLSFDYYTVFNNYYEGNQVEGYFIVFVNGKQQLKIPYNNSQEGSTYNVPLTAGTNTVEWNFIETKRPESESWTVGISNIDIKNAEYYTINATANNDSYGTAMGTGKYVYDQSATLKAVPNKGYLFKEWQLDGKTVSKDAEYTFLVTEDARYTAIFEADPDYKEDENKDDSGKDNGNKGDSGQGESQKDDDKNNHTHKAGEWIVTKEATAKTTGLKVKKCTVCGEEMEKEVLPKYKVSFNVKGTVPLQVKKSTTAIKVKLMEGDKIKSYKSSNTKIATVSKKGKIKAKKTGTVKITVTTKKGAKATIKIKVQKKPVKTKKITVDKKKLTLKKGKSYTLTVTKSPVTTLEKVSFKTSNKKVATVNKKGKIVAKKKGKATITVKCGTKKKTVKVTVK